MHFDAEMESRIVGATNAIRSADALLIGAGAGMGVDSGLSDFRGPEGFWNAYPAFRGREFYDISTPRLFDEDPDLAWGFFGHRLNLYRSTTPHAGFGIVRRWGEQCPLGWWVFTSNVDGQFQKADFPERQLLECHGSIHHLQCTQRCGQSHWSAGDIHVDVDEGTIRARSPLPTCPRCGSLARPNILMFDDCEWDAARYREQQARYGSWLRRIERRRVVAIEIGAGLTIPTVRRECERRASVLIRINPREPETPAGGISLPLAALTALQAIDATLENGQ